VNSKALGRRLVVLLAAVGVLVLTAELTSGGAIAQPPSAAPGYLSDDYGQLVLASNDLMSHAKVVGKAFRVPLFPKAQPELNAPIWTPRCPANAETVKFGRSVWLPGPPNYGGKFTFGAVLGQGEFGALSTIDLIVDGAVIVHQRLPSGTGYFTVPVSGAALKAFRFGANTIEVRVHKRRTRGQCNTHNRATQVGVLFRLAGGFQTDLAVNPSPPTSYYKLAPGKTFTEQVNVHFFNRGPGWEPNGKFQVNVDGAPKFALGSGLVPPPGPPLTNCQQSDNPNGISHVATCGLSDFAPATEGALSTIIQVTAPSSDYSDFSVGFTWYIGAGAVTDLNSSNNQSYATITLCGSKSTNPGCQTAQTP
jgi:hypothetical protein